VGFPGEECRILGATDLRIAPSTTLAGPSQRAWLFRRGSILWRKLRGMGFGAFLDRSLLAERLGGWGYGPSFSNRAKCLSVSSILTLEPKFCLKEGRFCSNFWGVVGPWFCWGFLGKWVVGRIFFVVNLWWIAGETWCVDGQFSGSKNMPLFPDLFLRDSHFGNFGSASFSPSRRTAMAVLRRFPFWECRQQSVKAQYISRYLWTNVMI
jgi:hypothetical protein